MSRRLVVLGLCFALLVLAGPMQAQGASSGVSSSGWEAQYWNNTALSGNPVLAEVVEHLGFDWGYGSPHPSINHDRFSARWSRRIEMAEGTYRFSVTSDDGVRVYVDERIIVDQWNDQPARTYSVDLELEAGIHHIVVEYYENAGVAKLALAWTPMPWQGLWQGEYYANPWLGGSPLVKRAEGAPASVGLDFDWGSGSPAAVLPVDGFSARWSRSLAFHAGSYRFTATADDGMRVWIDGCQIINAWRDQSPHTYTAEAFMAEGSHQIIVEYYERSGIAVAKLSWAASPSQDEIVVDDQDAGFMRGGSETAWRPGMGGYRDSQIWTQNSDRIRPNYNWGRWYPDLQAGRYEVFAYIPECDSATSSARYWVAHGNDFTLRTVSQADNAQRWVSLGTYDFQGTGAEYVSLADLTYEPYLSRRIAFDAVKWVPRESLQAQDALRRFFSLLAQRRYGEAAAYYGGDYDILCDWNPDVTRDDYAKLLEDGCTANGLQCLPVKAIVKERLVSEDERILTVEFSNYDGSLFASELVGSQFDYTVRRVGGRFLVQELPVYLP